MQKPAGCHRPSAAFRDLLPWADPYIVQLFAEAESCPPVGRPATSCRLACWTRDCSGGPLADSGVISPALRLPASPLSLVARRRRIESARLPARC